MDHAEESSVLAMPPAWLRAELVRAVGIEPTLLAERDFESRASTNSTTPAWRRPIAPPPEHATPFINNGAYFVGFVAFFREETGLGRALRTLTAEASMLFVKCRP
jgi:hypothetical protein